MTHGIALEGVVKFKFDSIHSALLANRRIKGVIVRKSKITSRWVFVDPADAAR